MIPHELRFHGIRDYEPTVIDLSGRGEHILIAGPNGSGKSTITFCMGAVLNSGKVDVEGLKSRNIQEDETWHASIHFLFKNEGPSRIDAPHYIEFSVQIEQEPHSPMKRVFTISSGDDMDTLTTQSSFRSGGQPNFSDYRRKLTDKYRIYPDDYYLIWYQQEVNQFAVMSPEERFRVFSEMHGISNIQKNWEASLEQVKDIATSVSEAENAVQNDKFTMLNAKTMYEHLLAYEESIETNGRIIIQSLSGLIDLYKTELHTVKGTIEELEMTRDDLMKSLSEFKDKQIVENEKLAKLHEEKEKLEKKLDRLEIGIGQKKNIAATLKENIHELEDQLKEIEEKSKRLLYTEAETKKRFTEKEHRLAELTKKITELTKKLEALEDENSHLVVERASLESTIKIYEEKEKEYAEILDQYNSRHAVEESIASLNKILSKKDSLIVSMKEEMNDLQSEQTALQRNHVVSKRQQDILDKMRHQKMKAYPMRSLVELDDHATLEAERKLDTIKYTIFYVGRKFTPVNDLYHVSLMEIVPVNFIDHLPELQLRIKRGLTEEEKNYAVKVLWWIKLFFSGDQPTVHEEQLIDVRGVRGVQEHETYILSQKALEIRKKELDKLITLKKEQLDQLIREKEKNTNDLQDLHSIVRRVAEAEAFRLEKHQHQLQVEKLTKLEHRLNEIVLEKKELRADITSEQEERARVRIELENLRNDLEIYLQLGEQKQQFEKLNDAKKRLEILDQQLRHLQEEYDNTDEQIRKLENRQSHQKRKVTNINQQIEDVEQELFAIKKQEEMKRERKEILQENILTNERELLDIKQLEPELYKDVIAAEDPSESRSEMKLNEDLMKAKTAFDITRKQTNINHEAGNIYKKAKETYEQKSTELDKLKVLLEENKERAEENEQYLITTIQMKVLRIHQLFQNYMTHFQFECDIDFDKYTERNGRVVFRLFIKVRKQGHRGKMEDVSLKARAGRVGKGVSGGEESLSSLLFALSLLQELDIRPSFIVLDEFDSALDEGRKAKVFDLYAKELERKLIIISPKGHENEYLDHFHKAYIARHDPNILKSILAGVRNSRAEEAKHVV